MLQGCKLVVVMCVYVCMCWCVYVCVRARAGRRGRGGHAFYTAVVVSAIRVWFRAGFAHPPNIITICSLLHLDPSLPPPCRPRSADTRPSQRFLQRNCWVRCVRAYVRVRICACVCAFVKDTQRERGEGKRGREEQIASRSSRDRRFIYTGGWIYGMRMDDDQAYSLLRV